MIEIYKPIVGYEGLYEVSNLGNVRSLDRYAPHNHGYKQKIKGKVLKQHDNTRGYMYVGLWKNGKQKKFYVHRLVAQAFIPNTDNLPEVNHKDEIKSNNCVYNLEWVTSKENANYGSRIERFSNKLKGRKLSEETKQKMRQSQPKKKVVQLSLDGEFIKIWNGTRETERNLKINHVGISACCKGKQKTAGGYKWMYYEDYLTLSN